MPRRLHTLAFVLGCSIVSTSRADRIHDGVGVYSDVKLLGLKDAQVMFQMPDGRILARQAAACLSLRLDAAKDPAGPILTQAEWHFERREYDAAMPLYHHVATETATGWFGTWARMRRVMIRDRMGQFEDAVGEWLRLASLNPVIAESLVLVSIPKPGADAAAVLRQLDERIRTSSDAALLSALRKLRANIEAGPMKPTEDELRAAGKTKGARSHRDRDTDELRQRVRQAIDEKDWSLAERLLKSGQKEAKGSKAAGWMLLRSQLLLARGEFDQAGLAAMDVVAAHPDRPEAVEGLYWAGRAYEGLGRAAKAVQLYNECVTSPKADPAVRRAAQDRLKALENRPDEK